MMSLSIKQRKLSIENLSTTHSECPNVDYEMIVVGNSNGAQPLLNRIIPTHLKLVNTVPQDELKGFLASSDVYLSPSLCEGCASSGMEALAAGLPVIATLESGFQIENEENGIIVEARNVSQIVEALLRLKSSQDLRTKLGTSASELIRQKFSWELYAQNVVSLYQDLLAH